MTELEDAAPDETPESSPLNYEVPDGLLQLLVELANRGVFEITVTLTVGGSQISGVLVSGRTWMENLREGFEGAFGTESHGKVLGEALQKWTDHVFPEPSTQNNDDDDDRVTAHIHLKNANIFQGGIQPIPGGEGTWWRGRLVAIDGFILGRLDA